MKKFIQIRVDTPCHESWEAMTPAAKGNFCESCKKTVVDFTVMSDNQVLEYFTKRSKNVCGRFYSDQLNKNLEMPVKQPSWIRYFFTIAIPTMLISAKADAQSNSKKIEQTILPVKQSNTCEDERSREVMGCITTVEGVPIPYVSVMIAGTRFGTSANINGSYKIKLTGKARTLEFSAVGYQSKVIDIPESGADVNMQPVLMNSGKLMGEVIVMGATRRARYRGKSNNNTSISQNKVVCKKPISTQSISVFPNPSKQNSVLTIRFSNPISGDQQVDLYSSSGVVKLHEVIQISHPTTDISVQLNSTDGGYYVLVVTYSKTKKRQSSSLIVY